MASKDSFVCCSYMDTNRHETDSVLKRGSAKTLSCLICLNRTFAFMELYGPFMFVALVNWQQSPLRENFHMSTGMREEQV